MNQQEPLGSKLHFLAISGSLRAASSNTTLLIAAVSLAPDHIEIELYDGLADLPYFNPDVEKVGAPPAVADFRAQLQACDAVLICSPEYAHGVPGVLKNALDWIVGSGEFMHKPVLLINASVASHHAQESLTETLTMMMAKVTSVRVPLPGNKIDEAGIVAHPELSRTLREAINELAQAASTTPTD